MVIAELTSVKGGSAAAQSVLLDVRADADDGFGFSSWFRFEFGVYCAVNFDVRFA